MDIGMLWFDNDKNTDTAAKIQRASAYYKDKYGKAPNLCFVHPATMPEVLNDTGGVEVRTSNTMLPNHYWIGINRQEPGRAQ